MGVFHRPWQHIPTFCLTCISLSDLEEMSCICIDSPALIILNCIFTGKAETINLVTRLIPIHTDKAFWAKLQNILVRTVWQIIYFREMNLYLSIYHSNFSYFIGFLTTNTSFFFLVQNCMHYAWNRPKLGISHVLVVLLDFKLTLSFLK